MAKILTFEIPENEYNDLQSFLKDCSAEIHKSLESIKQDQIEINRSRKESEKIHRNIERVKSETRIYLKEIGRAHV